MNKLAPIVLFTYNRLWHTQQTIEALQKNELAEESEFFIYSDGGKDEKSWEMVNEVRQYLKTIGGFKNITIIEQEKNLGLADSIISGVTKIINKYGKIIVLEDDIVTSPYFLRFMNDALDFYENEEKVWHISGWNYPIESQDVDATFFSRVMNCWGWSTWKNKWQYFEKDVTNLINSFSEEEIYRFNLDGIEDFWSQVTANFEGKIDTWAIFWYATIFKNNALCLNPVRSFTKNIGFDIMATHTKGLKKFDEILQESESIKFCQHYEESIVHNLATKLYLCKIHRDELNRNFLIKLNQQLFAYYAQLDILKNKNKKYIIYGAGTGAKFILTYMYDFVEDIIDINDNKIGTTLFGLKIKNIDIAQTTSLQIIISVFGREDEIVDILVNKFSVQETKIIKLYSKLES